MLHVCFVRSPFARARIHGIDASAALALPGVRGLLAAADVNPDVHEYWYTLYGRAGSEMPRPPLAEREARFVGDPVALVLADDRYVGEDAADLVDVDFEPLTPLVDYAAAQDADALVHEEYPGNVAGTLGVPMSDVVVAAFDGAAHVVSRRIYQQAYVPVPMETRGIIVEWTGEELTVWTGTQAPHEVRLFMSRLLGLGEHQVRVIMRDTGGGFGEKVAPLREDACVALAARQVGQPLKWVEDRRENLIAAGMSRHEHGDARLAFDGDGRIVGAYLDHVQNVGAYPKPSPVGASAAVGSLFPGPYRVAAAGFRTTSVFSNTSGRIAYRGPWQFESVAREVLLDIAARSMGVDPIDLRRRNLLREDEMPFRNPNGMTYTHVTPLETFEHAMAILDYPAFRKEQAEKRGQGRYLGVGTCSYVEPTTSALGYYATEGATIRIEPTGKVNVYVSGGSTGNSLETAVVQLAADALGVHLGDVRTVQGDTAVTPFGGGTGGSRSGSMLAGAIGETSRCCASASWLSRPTCWRRRPKTLTWPMLVPVSAGHQRRPSLSPIWRTSPTSRPSACRPTSHPGSRPADGTGPRPPSLPTPPTSAPVRSTSPLAW
jgi:carbon-monoxide dehydrogenase large subunit